MNPRPPCAWSFIVCRACRYLSIKYCGVQDAKATNHFWCILRSIGTLQGLYKGNRKISDLGSDGAYHAIFTLNYQLWKGQKLRKIILLHGELETLIFHFAKIQHVFISILSRPGGNIHDPPNQLVSTLNLNNFPKQFKKNRHHLDKYIFWKFQNLENLKVSKIEEFGIDACRKSCDPSSRFLKILNMESIFWKTRNEHVVLSMAYVL